MMAQALSPAERTALTALADAWNTILPVLPDTQQRIEAMFAIHQLQFMVMAQPTLRAHADLLRQPSLDEAVRSQQEAP